MSDSSSGSGSRTPAGDGRAQEPTRRRRLDRIVAEDYLDGLEGWDLDTVRARRDDCRAEEDQLSYLRRMLQARLDIARAWQAHRGGAGDRDDLLAALPSLLADPDPSPSQEPRAVSINPPEHQMRRQEDRLAVDSTLARLPDLDDDELADVVTRLQEEETRVSALRRTVLDRLDALQEALVVRYREAEAGRAGGD